MRATLPLVLTLLLTTAAAPAISPDTDRASRPPAAGAGAIGRIVDEAVRPMLARGDLSGQLLVTRGGRVLVERYWGFANRELGAPITNVTRFNIASVTKPMTVVLLIQLLQEKKLALRDSIARWFPDFPTGDSITVAHLLNHRSGIRHDVIPDSEMVRPFSAAEVVERAKRVPLDFRPGERESYSSGGFEVLARVLELAGGATYDTLLERRICAPLGMAHTGHIDGRSLVAGRAAAYVAGAHGIENATPQDLSGLVGAGSVWSTARDLERFVQGIVSGKLGPGPKFSYLRQGRLDFNGRTGGFKAWALYDSATATCATFVSNTASGAPDWLKSSILRLAAGERVPPPVLPALKRDATQAELEGWVGIYQIERGPRLDLHLKDGVLYSNDWAMVPTVDGGLFCPRDYGLIRGVPGADGRLARIDWVQAGRTYPAPRVEK